MRAFRIRFTVWFFWAPLIVSLLLNPGRNAEHIHQFSVPKLLLLAISGICAAFYFVVGFTQFRIFSFAFTDKPQAWRDISLLLLALISGLIDIYFAWLGLQLPWHWL